jgi:hypothetical protein
MKRFLSLFLILASLLLLVTPAHAVKYLLVASGGGTPDPDPEYNTPAYVNGTSGSADPSAATLALTAFSTTSGNAIIVGAFDYDGTSVSGVTDTASNTYVYCGKDPSNYMEVWAAYNITGNSSNVITITWASATTARRGSAHQVSGIAASSAFDVFGHGSSTGTAVSTASVTTTQTHEYLFGWMIEASSSTPTPGSGWTTRVDPAGSIWSGDQIVTSTGSYNFTATLGSSALWYAVIATFKASEYVPDETAPVHASTTVNGTDWTFNFDDQMQVGTGGGGGLAATMTTAGAISFSSVAASGTTITATGSPAVESGDTLSSGVSYTQPGNGLENTDGVDVASFSNHTSFTNSTASGESVTYVGVEFESGPDSVTVNIPAAAESGDMLIAGYNNDVDIDDDPAPSGWTSLGYVVTGSSRMEIYYRTHNGTDTTVTLSRMAGSWNASCFCMALTSTGTWSTPTITTATTGASPATSLQSSSTTVAAGNMLVGVWGNDGANVPSAVPTNMSTGGADAGKSYSVAAYYEAITSGGSITRTCSYSASEEIANAMIVVGVE